MTYTLQMIGDITIKGPLFAIEKEGRTRPGQSKEPTSAFANIIGFFGCVRSGRVCAQTACI